MRAWGIRVALLAFGWMAGCLQPGSVQCPGGLVCPPGSQCAAHQEACIRGLCGNGVLDHGEVCDDGNIKSGDGCKADCSSDESCGNGIIDKGEVCDDGADNAPAMGPCPTQKCSHDCKSFLRCGDTIIDTCKGEVCDDGPNNAPSEGPCPTQKCSADCKSDLSCGNTNTDNCKGEVCDKGQNNGVPDSGCAINCKSNGHCGNDVMDIGEACDPGPDDGDGNMCNRSCAAETQSCNRDCTPAACGDGKLNLRSLNLVPTGLRPTPSL